MPRLGRWTITGDPPSHEIEQLSVPPIVVVPERPTVEIDQGNMGRLEDRQDEGGTGEAQAIPEHQLAIPAVEASVGTAAKCIGYLVTVARVGVVVSVMDQTTHCCDIINFFVFE
jgi:hypothetical protein